MTRKSKAPLFTKDSIKFKAWKTEVEDDDLGLHTLNLSEDRILTATFSSKQQQHVVFTFDQVNTFRVLDEKGLLDLWTAWSATSRTAKTTFRVSGHLWQKESPLIWIEDGGEEPVFSYMVATGWDCLEVISLNPPRIRIGRAGSS